MDKFIWTLYVKEIVNDACILYLCILTTKLHLFAFFFLDLSRKDVKTLKKTKKMILTSERHAQHLFGGLNTQQRTSRPLLAQNEVGAVFKSFAIFLKLSSS